MYYKVIFIILIFLIAPLFTQVEVSAQAKERNVTVIYSSQNSDIPPEVQKLEALISHFSERIELIRDIELKSDSLIDTSHLFYIGVSPMKIPSTTRSFINLSNIPVYGLGYNVEQLELFDELELQRMTGVSKFHQTRTDKTITFANTETAFSVSNPKSYKVHARMIKGNSPYPTIIQTESHFYSGIYNLFNRSSLLVADSLFDFFKSTASEEHLGYLRLEDVNPTSEPKLLETVGQYLLDRDVPILLAVIAVYVDPKTGQEMFFEDNPKLIEVIRNLEKQGATVLSHGYTHQYQSSETGEGFEFWDVENNQPIFVPVNEIPPQLKTRESFSNEAEYNKYWEELLKGQTLYIETKLTSAIHELVSQGLHPLGFESPHYTMSHTGYKITAKHFSNIFGQIQWSNFDWETMGAPPYITKPSLLHGMTLYPETIGYFQPELPQPVSKMERARDELLLVRESVIGAFYHPYLGVQNLPEIVDMMESTPGFKWLNLRDENERVITEDISITTKDGRLILHDERPVVWNKVKSYLPQSFIERVLLGLAMITFVAVVTFITYTLYLRKKRKKFLFDEKN